MADLDPIDRVRAAVTDRAELPGMSLMEHLGELRTRLLHSIAYLAVGFVIAYIFHVRLVGFIQKPLVDIGLTMTMTHPTDALNFFIKTSFVCGAILASPFILYQVWLFISPGMYANEKRYVWPFMSATVGLFLAGAWFGYRYVLPGAMVILIQDFGKNFTHMITIEDYTGFFLAVILGLGICFELPIVIFFLALFGIVDGKFLLRHFRYAVLAIFLIAAIICPSPEPTAMCLFATPMLVLYFLGVGVAFLVHPDRKKAKEKTVA
ncbi:twin-arginine translocase subunit TatC [Granulicella arctica]|uniref:Sec-independent protein translocase protein TatC n=1 Tax=Granulicella arctica TaxID=940613 RepID=A0A7Y9PGV8_9BACT|nr:twin-arginine translocase subunit TatC [Granulicella arctica]NYF79514.1 sec-independent protein translocase protein TatC [Granulicella arctica]